MDAATRDQVETLGEWTAGLTWERVPDRVRQRLRLVLIDVLGITVVGACEPEQRRLVDVWDVSPGPSPLFGAGRHATVEAAAWLNALALVRLELDEGHKFAKGHPAAHAFPAVLALASAKRVAPADLLTALLAAYEVASRYGRATSLRAGMHPHGSWGVAGAAAGCAKLLGLDAAATAAAIDAATGMPIAGHFDSAMDGNRVRDAWMGASNLAGLASARLAAAGLASNTGTAAGSLGDLLGRFDPALTTEQLGERWDIEAGYFKQHAACSFTHPAADALLALRAEGQLPDAAAIDSVVVETHSLAVGLNRTTWSNGLSAMFSLPFVVASALVHGSVGPEASRPDRLRSADVVALAERVEVRGASDLDARLPAERATRVTVTSGADRWTVERPNPVGDSAFHPFDEPALLDLLGRLLGDPDQVQRVVSAVDEIFSGTGLDGLDCLAEPATPNSVDQRGD